MPQVRRDKFPIFMHYKASDATLNGIPAGTVINKAFVEAKLNHIDETKRWWVFPQFENLVSPPPTAETEEIGGKPIPTGEELKAPITWDHFGGEANPALKACYDSIKCEELGVIFVTFSGQLNGMNDGDGNLVSIKLQQGTLSAQYSPPVKGTVQKIMCSMMIDELENDANRDYIDTAQIAYPAKNWFALQPIEVIASSSANAGGLTIDVYFHSLYGGVGKKKPVVGVATSWLSVDGGVTPGKVYNETDAAAITATVAAGAEDGEAVITMAPGQTIGDVIRIELFKTGYHMRPLKVTLTGT